MLASILLRLARENDPTRPTAKATFLQDVMKTVGKSKVGDLLAGKARQGLDKVKPAKKPRYADVSFFLADKNTMPGFYAILSITPHRNADMVKVMAAIQDARLSRIMDKVAVRPLTNIKAVPGEPYSATFDVGVGSGGRLTLEARRDPSFVMPSRPKRTQRRSRPRKTLERV